jgi:anti-sigma regulatory factor (Ser/Thr protein kinase)
MAPLRPAPPVPPGAASVRPDHRVELYSEESQLAASVATFLRPALAGGLAVVVATPGHRHMIREALAAHDADVDYAVSQGSLVLLDADDTLSRFLVDGSPDGWAFRESVGGLLTADPSRTGPVRVYGEMVTVLWEQGAVAAAMELEDLWNQLGAVEEFALLCGYPSALFSSDGSGPQLEEMCARHTAVTEHEGRERTAGWALPAALTSGAQARGQLRELLDGSALRTVLDEAQLLVTELVNNAVVHARSDVLVRVDEQPGALRVAVSDRGQGRWRRRPAPPDATSGRGLLLVEALADTWGTAIEGDTKTVWFELRPRSAA